MVVGREWLIRFALEVPRPTRKRLINLGLPVAGIDFEVKKDGSVVFDGVLRVSRDGKFYWKRRRLTVREFVNIASLLTQLYSHVIDELSRLIDLRNVRIINGTDLKVGGVVIREIPTARLVDTMYTYGLELSACRPLKKVPANVTIVDYREDVTLYVRRGPFTVGVVYHPEEDVVEADLLYRSVSVCGVEADPFEDVVDDGDIGKIVKAAEENVFREIIKTPWGFKFRGYEVYEFDGATIVVRDEDPLNVYEGASPLLLGSGWRFYYVDGKKAFYRKRAGAIRLEYGEEGMKIFFANGSVYSTAEPGILVHSNDLNTYLEVMALL